MSCNQIVLELAHDVGSHNNNNKLHVTTVIDRLRVKGAPAPRNTPASPLLSRSNRPIPSTVIALDKSYEIVLKHANKQLIEAGNTVAVRRVDFLNRLQHANQGMTSMDSPASSSEFGLTEEKPSFVLCGHPVNGMTPKTIDKYLKDQRVGSYKTSAHEVSRVKLQNKVSKTKNEPSPKSANAERSVNFNDELSVQDVPSPTKSVGAGNNAPPTTPAPSIVSLQKRGIAFSNNLELSGRNFKSASSPDWSLLGSSQQHKSKSRYRGGISRSAGGPYNTFLRVNNSERARSDLSSEPSNFSLPNSFSTKGIKKFNNPYRLLKHSKREILLHQKETTDYENLRKVTSPPKSAPIHNAKHLDVPKSILRVPNPCSDTFLLQMMLDSNILSGKKHPSSKYSDIAVQRDLEEFMMVRSPSSPVKGVSPGPKSLKSARSGKSMLNGVEEESVWPGNEVHEEVVNKTNSKFNKR